MAEPALQYDEFEDIEPIEIPAGGIATFLTAREGIAADANDEIPQSGIAQVKAVADQLAEFGRYEDQYMVHAAHGETVIPMEVFRKNPILKENIYKQMRDMGLEPERYVVGSDFNSINPVTGQPEFFLKKIFKGVKNVFKGVKKVFKVVAPIVLQAVLTPIVGPIFAGAITGGITSLAQGGSFKDALKAAAIGGAIGGITKAVKGAAGAASEGKNIFAGAKEGFMAARGSDPFIAGKFTGLTEQPIQAVGGPPLEFTATPEGELIRDPIQANLVETTNTALAGASQGPYMPSNVSTTQQNLVQVGPNEPFDPVTNPGGRIGGQNVTATSGQNVTSPAGQNITPATTAVSGTTELIPAPTVTESLSRFVPGVGKPFNPYIGARDLLFPGVGQRAAAEQYVEKTLGLDLNTVAGKEALKELSLRGFQDIGFMRKFGPGIAGILAYDALTQEEPEDFNVAEKVENPLIGDPKYSPGDFFPRPTYTIATLGPDDFVVPSSSNVYQPVPGVAQGGGIDENIFPRMNGPIEGPGTETSDDIPAMLSDGEFVMTAKAVRGAGNGSRREGMRNMYQMMSNFEAKA